MPTPNPDSPTPSPVSPSLLEAVEIEIDACPEDYAMLDSMLLKLRVATQSQSCFGTQLIFQIRFQDLPCIRHTTPKAWLQPVNLELDSGDTSLILSIHPKFPPPGPRAPIRIRQFFHIGGRRTPGTDSTIPAGVRHTEAEGADINL